MNKTTIKTSIKGKENIYVKEDVEHIFEELNKKGTLCLLLPFRTEGLRKKRLLKIINKICGMKNLKERMLELRSEIKALKYERNAIQKQIDQKEDVLEELEKLTVNQLDMFNDA